MNSRIVEYCLEEISLVGARFPAVSVWSRRAFLTFAGIVVAQRPIKAWACFDCGAGYCGPSYCNGGDCGGYCSEPCNDCGCPTGGNCWNETGVTCCDCNCYDETQCICCDE